MGNHDMRNGPEHRHTLRIARRRDVLIGAAAAASLLALFTAAGATGATAQDKPSSADLDAALKKIMGTAKPADGRITLDIPEIAENGNTIPFVLSVESPMTETDHVKALHVLAAANLQPGIASYSFTPASGRAFVASRMRLARTQDVIAVAEMSDGRFLLGRRTVKVTIGGCGG